MPQDVPPDPRPLDELYQATIVAHDRAPHNCGALADPTHDATVDNPLCGDVVTVQARVIDGVVCDIAFAARGCALSRAAASIMTTMVRDVAIGASRDLAARFEQFVQSAPDAAIPDELGELRAFAGVRRFRSRRVCALLPFRALSKALGPDM
jgi:nitrogen fixation protein NifU and related proteins